MPNLVDIWQRQNLPQGRLAVPTAGPSIAETFGSALTDAGAVGSKFAAAQAEMMERKDKLDADASLVAGANDMDSQYAALQENAPANGAGFTNQVSDMIEKVKSKLMSNIPASQQKYAETKFDEVAGSIVAKATAFQVVASAKAKGLTAQKTADSAANMILSNPDRYQWAADTAINSVKALKLPADKEAELISDMSQNFAAAAVAGKIQRDAKSGLAELNSGVWDGKLDPTKKAQLMDVAERSIRAQDAQAREDQRQNLLVARAAFQDNLDIAQASLKATGTMPVDSKGQPLVSKAEAMRLYPGTAGEIISRQIDAWGQEGQDRLEIATTPLSQDMEKLAALSPEPGAPFTPEQADRLQAYQNALSAKQRALADDPAGYVISLGSSVSKAWQQADDLKASGAPADQVDAAYSRASAATIQAQLDMGIPAWQAKPLPKSMAQGYAGTLRVSNPDAVVSTAREVAQYGPGAVSQVIAAGAPAGFAAMAAVPDPIWSKQLAIGMNTAESEKAALIKVRGATEKTLDLDLKSKMGDFLATLPPTSQPLYLDAVRDVSIMNLARGMTLSDAVDAAVRPLLSQSNISGKLRVPKEYDLGAVTAGLSRSVRDIISGDTPFDIVPPPSGVPGLTTEDEMTALRVGLRNGSYSWITNAAGDGAILTLPNGTYIVSGNSGRVEVPFSVAERLGKEAGAPKRPAPGNPLGYGGDR
jgi:hypothetical protein